MRWGNITLPLLLAAMFVIPTADMALSVPLQCQFVKSPRAGRGILINAINDKGQVVGAFIDAKGNRHGFLYREGNYNTKQGVRGFVSDHGHDKIFSVPGTPCTSHINGINTRGQIVGSWTDGTISSPRYHSFILLP